MQGLLPSKSSDAAQAMDSGVRTVLLKQLRVLTVLAVVLYAAGLVSSLLLVMFVSLT